MTTHTESSVGQYSRNHTHHVIPATFSFNFYTFDDVGNSVSCELVHKEGEQPYPTESCSLAEWLNDPSTEVEEKYHITVSLTFGAHAQRGLQYTQFVCL